ncbi:hypothetical protein [Nonomuraea sp. NPDC003709]
MNSLSTRLPEETNSRIGAIVASETLSGCFMPRDSLPALSESTRC